MVPVLKTEDNPASTVEPSSPQIDEFSIEDWFIARRTERTGVDRDVVAAFTQSHRILEADRAGGPDSSQSWMVASALQSPGFIRPLSGLDGMRDRSVGWCSRSPGLRMTQGRGNLARIPQELLDSHPHDLTDRPAIVLGVRLQLLNEIVRQANTQCSHVLQRNTHCPAAEHADRSHDLVRWVRWARRRDEAGCLRDRRRQR